MSKKAGQMGAKAKQSMKDQAPRIEPDATAEMASEAKRGRPQSVKNSGKRKAKAGR